LATITYKYNQIQNFKIVQYLHSCVNDSDQGKAKVL